MCLWLAIKEDHREIRLGILYFKISRQRNELRKTKKSEVEIGEQEVNTEKGSSMKG